MEDVTDQILEDVLLVDVNRDQRLVFRPFVVRQLQRRHVDELVQNLAKLLISRLHDLLVDASVLQRLLRPQRPQHLDAEQPHLAAANERNVNGPRNFPEITLNTNRMLPVKMSDHDVELLIGYRQVDS